MEYEKNYISAVEGVDELGNARAVCSLTIQRPIDGLQSEVIQSVATMDAEVSICFTKLWVTVDLKFEDNLDFDYLQMSQVCLDYAKLQEEEAESMSLVLAITPLGEYDFFLVGVEGIWCFQSDKPEGICNTIRFIFMKQCFGTYELTTKAMEQMILEAGMENEESEQDIVCTDSARTIDGQLGKA